MFIVRFFSPIIFLLFLCWHISGISQNKKPAFNLEVVNSNNLIEKLQFNTYNALKRHTDSLSNVTQHKGYLSSYYSLPRKKNDSTYQTHLIRNKKTNYVVIKNSSQLPNFIKKILRLKKKKTSPLSIPITNIEAFLQNLNQKIAKTGNPFNSIRLEKFTSKNDTLYSNLLIENIEKRTIDSIFIKGYTKFPKGFLTHYIGVKQNTLFNNEVLQEKTQQINNLPFTKLIKPAEVLFNPKSTKLFIYVAKKNANNFDGFLGFSTDEDSGNLKLDGYLNLNLINNLNLGEEFKFTYKSDSEDQTQFIVDVRLPYIFNLPLGLEAGLNIFRQQEAFSSTEQKIGLNYAFTPRIEIFTGLKKYESADLNENSNVVGSINNNFESTFINSELRYKQKQAKPLFPFKTEAVIGTELGSRINENTPKINQTKWLLLLKHIFQLNQRNSIYLANNLRYLNSNNYLANELYRFGGILSIRGFEENSLRASFYNVINTEYRYLFSKSIYIHSIIDFAFIDNQSPKSTLDNTPVGSDKLTSFGIGFGMLTKAGLFKLNFANGTSNDIPFKFGNSKIHLSLTAYF